MTRIDVCAVLQTVLSMKWFSLLSARLVSRASPLPLVILPSMAIVIFGANVRVAEAEVHAPWWTTVSAEYD